MGDLDKLIAAVEAGGWPDRRTEVAAFYSGGPISHCNECAGLARQANAGSLDAALRLHEALLPGWGWVLDEAVDGRDVHVYAPTGAHKSSGTADHIARAWLLAILRALKAKGEP